MYFLINLRTFCVISCTFGINIGTYCENMCTNVKTESEMWKTIAFHWLNPIYALLSQIGKCREINLRNFLPQQLQSQIFLTNIMYDLNLACWNLSNLQILFAGFSETLIGTDRISGRDKIVGNHPHPLCDHHFHSHYCPALTRL